MLKSVCVCVTEYVCKCGEMLTVVKLGWSMYKHLSYYFFNFPIVLKLSKICTINVGNKRHMELHWLSANEILIHRCLLGKKLSCPIALKIFVFKKPRLIPVFPSEHLGLIPWSSLEKFSGADGPMYSDTLQGYNFRTFQNRTDASRCGLMPWWVNQV